MTKGEKNMERIYIDENAFRMYPFARSMTEKQTKFVLKEKMEELKEKEDMDRQVLLLEKIIQKFDGTDTSWKKKNYAYIRRQLTMLSPTLCEIIYPNLIELFQAKEEDIQHDIELFSKNTTYYPEVSREKTKEGYVTVQSESTPFDIFHILFLTTRNIGGSLQKYAQSLLSIYDRQELIDFIGKTVKGEEERGTLFFLQNLEQEYGFLKDSKLFQTLYASFQEKYLSILYSYVYMYANRMCHREIANTRYQSNPDEYRSLKYFKKYFRES